MKHPWSPVSKPEKYISKLENKQEYEKREILTSFLKSLRDAIFDSLIFALNVAIPYFSTANAIISNITSWPSPFPRLRQGKVDILVSTTRLYHYAVPNQPFCSQFSIYFTFMWHVIIASTTLSLHKNKIMPEVFRTRWPEARVTEQIHMLSSFCLLQCKMSHVAIT